jgi:hypothetical protein
MLAAAVAFVSANKLVPKKFVSIVSKINKTTPTSHLRARGGGGDDVAVVIA